MGILGIALAIAAWGFIHSLLASFEAKGLFQRWFGGGVKRFYRFTYIIFSLFSFLPIIWLMAVLPDRRLYAILFPWVIFPLTGQALAVILLVAGILQTDTIEFTGLRQLFSKGDDRQPELFTRGVYRWVRHPLYTAGVLFIWLTPVMSLNRLVVYTALTIYIVIGAFFEERRLLREVGVRYIEYQASTPMLIPCLKKKL